MSRDGGDLDRLLAEIDEEVSRRRAGGELTSERERELDGMFAGAAPPAVTGDFPRLLDQAQGAAAIDATPPVDSQRAGGPAVKRALGRAMSWYVGNVARQVTALGTDLVEALRLLGERVERIERHLPSTPGADRADGLLEPHLDPKDCSPAAIEMLEGTSGRVLHGDAGDGSLVRALADAGFDAYGVEPRARLAELAGARNTEVREQSVLEHLVTVPSESLGGLVLSGCVDTLPNRPRRQLLELAHSALRPGARVVIIAADAERWRTDPGTRVVADLAPGQPWHPETWARCLADGGFTVGSAPRAAAGRAEVITAVRGNA